MTTISATYNKQDIEELAEASAEALEKISNFEFQNFFSELSLEVLEDIDESFENQRDPFGKAWEPLKPSTLRIRRTRKRNRTNSTKILYVTGQLKNSIQSSITNRSMTLKTNRPYAGVHQFGNPQNKLFGNPAPIPVRKFLPLDDAGEISFPSHIQEKIDDMLDVLIRDALKDL